MINIKILTGYPEMFPGGLAHSLMGKALNRKYFQNRDYKFTRFWY